jgi:hypothetical protein
VGGDITRAPAGGHSAEKLGGDLVTLCLPDRRFTLPHEEAIGVNPSPADSIAYAIVVLSVGGIFFGIVWARTKNLFAVMFIHAATDLLPNLKEFVQIWGI